MKSRVLSLFPVITILLTVFVWLSESFAAPPSLKGQYAFTGESSCLISTTVMAGTPQTNSGFTADLKAKGPSFVDSFSVHGVRTFNGDGTGTVVGTSVAITYDNVSPSASSQDFQFSFTYTMQPDGTFTSHVVPGSFLGTIVAGPRTGQTVTVDDFSLNGATSQDGKSITLATDTPAVETHSFSNGDVQERICHRSRVLVWLGVASPK